MRAEPATATHSVILQRALAAPRERIYRAWTEPDTIARWFAPSDDFSVTVHLQELRIGGRFRIEMRHSSGKSHIATGVYRELDPPGRLAFTWRWEEEPDTTDTLVTIELEPLGDRSQLTFRHELFTTEHAADEHNKGWTGCLDRLAALLQTP